MSEPNEQSKLHRSELLVSLLVAKCRESIATIRSNVLSQNSRYESAAVHQAIVRCLQDAGYDVAQILKDDE